MDSGERHDVKDSGERSDVRDSGAGNLMPDVKDSRESAPSTTHDTQLTRTTRYPMRERRPPKHLDGYVTDLDEDQCMSNVDYFYRKSSFPQPYKKASS